MTDLSAAPVDLVASESTFRTVTRSRATASVRPARARLVPKRLVLALVVVWALWHVGIGRRELVNGAGWSQLGEFFRSAIHPDFSVSTLRAVWMGARVTLAYAVLGTIGSAVLGVPLGVFAASAWRGERRRWTGRMLRAMLIPARGSHEVIWALLLLNVLGLDPLVAVLAITIPFAAVTAQVVSQLLDSATAASAQATRATGAPPFAVLSFAVLPLAARDIASYVGYRFECALRAAAVLGVAGAGGLGQELRLSFLSLRYDQMWTFLLALIALGGAADAVSSRLRDPAARRSNLRPRGTRIRSNRTIAMVFGAVAVGAAGWAWLELDIRLSSLWSQRTRGLASELWSTWLPPDLAAEHVRLLIRLGGQTLAISIVAAVIACVLAVPLAFVAARPHTSGAVRQSTAWLTRFALLVLRAIPPSVWAFLVVLVLFPGPLPAAVALGVYNAGVLGRLLGETVENLPDEPIAALRATGASGAAVFVTAIVPLSIRRFGAYGLYRWEAALRETIVVGIVASGGLGQYLGSRLAAFDYPRVTAAVIAMILLTLVVDTVSGRLRRTLG